MTSFAYLNQASVGPMAARTANQGAISKKALWTGRIISWLAILFLLMDGVMKVFKPVFVVEATVRLGYPESAIFGTGALLIAFTLLYALPRTRVLGAVLLTGYLGGAVAIQVRALSSQFESVFPVLFGALLWAGVWLRDTRVRSLTNA